MPRFLDMELDRRAPVPVGRQLAAHLAGVILDEVIAPGRRLPSVRWLARRLGVHRNTVSRAYRELVAAGLAHSLQGRGVFAGTGHESGPYVGYGGSPAASRGRHGHSEDAFRRYVAAERRAGAARPALARRFARWSTQGVSGGLTVVEPEPALRELVAAELSSSGLQACGRDPRWLIADPARGELGIPVARPAVCRWLEARLPAWCEVIPLGLRGGSRELEWTSRLPDLSVVAVVTGSSRVRRFAASRLAGRAGAGFGVMTPHPRDDRALVRALRIARPVFADVGCAELPVLRHGPCVVTFRVLRRSWVAGLREYVVHHAPADGAARREVS